MPEYEPEKIDTRHYEGNERIPPAPKGSIMKIQTDGTVLTSRDAMGRTEIRDDRKHTVTITTPTKAGFTKFDVALVAISGEEG